MKCDLCHIEEAASQVETSILCLTCTNSISRLITIKRWMKHRLEDDMRNKLQEKMLVAYVKGVSKAASVNGSAKTIHCSCGDREHPCVEHPDMGFN